mmetsp:Transcript_13620/g.27394  ORF Transcript_13620/g.27394 Transcript_13620/m.27394 type:complete len:285 (-) Transcript_13620:2458-3312(-)
MEEVVRVTIEVTERADDTPTQTTATSSMPSATQSLPSATSLWRALSLHEGMGGGFFSGLSLLSRYLIRAVWKAMHLRGLHAEEGKLDEVDKEEPCEVVSPDERNVRWQQLLDNEAAGEEGHAADKELHEHGPQAELAGWRGEEGGASGAHVEDEEGRRVRQLKEHARHLVLEAGGEAFREESAALCVEDGGRGRQDKAEGNGDDEEAAHRWWLPLRWHLKVGADGDDRHIVDEGEEKGVEHVKGRVVHKGEGAEEGDQLDHHADPVHHVGHHSPHCATRLFDGC